jgi:hypothetical protein
MALVLLGLGATPACAVFAPESASSVDTGKAGPHSSEIDAYFATLSSPVTDAPQRRDGAPGPDTASGDYVCQTVHVDHTRPYETFVPYDADLLSPGAILPGDALDTGTFAPVLVERRRIEPSRATQDETTAQIEEVDSSDQLALALGARDSWKGAGDRIAGGFHFGDTSVRSRFVVRYSKASYRVEVQAPRSASELFAPTVDLAEVRTKMPPGIVPAYVSSMTYGRMVIFAIESPFSAEETWAALRFAFKGEPELNGQFSLTHAERISGSRIHAYALGSADDGAAVAGYAAMRELMGGGEPSSKDSPVTPIAYALRDIRDGSPRTMTLTRDFDVKTCQRVNQRVRVTLGKFVVDEPAATSSLHGTIVARSDVDAVVLFRRSSSEGVDVSSGQTPAPELLGELVLNVIPQVGSSLALDFDMWSRSPSADLPLGDPTSDETEFRYENGWRKASTIRLKGSGVSATVHLAMRPM